MSDEEKGATDAINTRFRPENGRELPDGAQLASSGTCAWGSGTETAERDYVLGHPDNGADNGEAEEGAKARKQRIEEIDPLTLPCVAMSELRYLPRRAGIYFVIEECGNVAYVGQSLNIRLRWSGHPVAAELCAPTDLATARRILITWLIVEDRKQLNELERSFIQRFRPRLNQQHKAEPKPAKTGKPKPTKEVSPTMTVPEAAKLKGCSKTTILQLIRKKVLPAKRIGPIFLIPRYAVEACQLPGQGKGPRPRARKEKLNP